MLIWGGGGCPPSRPGGSYLCADGALYDPLKDQWRAVSAANAPAGREQATAAWTGTELVVWGGRGDGGYLNDGGRYNPASDTWARLPPSNLSPRIDAAAVWTGSEAIVWGGQAPVQTSDGAAFNPTTNSWRPLPPPPPEWNARVNSAVA